MRVETTALTAPFATSRSRNAVARSAILPPSRQLPRDARLRLVDLVGQGVADPAHRCLAFAISGRAGIGVRRHLHRAILRSEEHTSELQSLMRISYAVFCLQKKITIKQVPEVCHTCPYNL